MGSTNPFFTYWYFHLPNLLLATLMYTVLGRFLLSFIFEPNSTNYIWRAFVAITDFVVRMVAFVTPKAVPHLAVLLFTAVWLFMARAALLILYTALGIAPIASAANP